MQGDGARRSSSTTLPSDSPDLAPLARIGAVISGKGDPWIADLIAQPQQCKHEERCDGTDAAAAEQFLACRRRPRLPCARIAPQYIKATPRGVRLIEGRAVVGMGVEPVAKGVAFGRIERAAIEAGNPFRRAPVDIRAGRCLFVHAITHSSHHRSVHP